jgi:hypothetical protein
MIANYPVVGTLNVSMDGCLQGRYGDNRCSETGEAVQLQKIQIADAFQRMLLALLMGDDEEVNS